MPQSRVWSTGDTSPRNHFSSEKNHHNVFGRSPSLDISQARPAKPHAIGEFIASANGARAAACQMAARDLKGRPCRALIGEVAIANRVGCRCECWRDFSTTPLH